MGQVIENHLHEDHREHEVHHAVSLLIHSYLPASVPWPLLGARNHPHNHAQHGNHHDHVHHAGHVEAIGGRGHNRSWPSDGVPAKDQAPAIHPITEQAGLAYIYLDLFTGEDFLEIAGCRGYRVIPEPDPTSVYPDPDEVGHDAGELGFDCPS